GRDQRNEVGVAATLAEAVQRALYLARAGAHGGKRVGDSVVGVVVGVDADMVAGDDLRRFGDDALDLVGQRAAVGVAQDHPARAGVVGGARAFERVGRVGLVAVEEVLAVD